MEEWRANSGRDSWDGQKIGVTARGPEQGPGVAGTRASIRPRRAGAFWRQSPPSEEALARAQGCRLAMGLGEAPVLRQATLSLWQSQAHMLSLIRIGRCRRSYACISCRPPTPLNTTDMQKSTVYALLTEHTDTKHRSIYTSTSSRL